MSRAVIALLTDFGTADHYVGTMKGVVLGICADVTFVDISHEMSAHDILGAALELAASFRYFPPETIFLVVVDPGVGSSRRAIAAEAGGYRFVAPDNGVLTMVFDEIAPRHVVELTEARYARPTISKTFEGRDRFAPAAAWLATGVELGALGRPVQDVRRLQVPAVSKSADSLDGAVVRIDRFGNLISNIDRTSVESFIGIDSAAILVGPHPVKRIVSPYAEMDDGELCGLFSSSGHLEIAVRGASAAARIGAERSTPLTVHVARRK